MAFLNVTVERTLSLVNSDGYQLTALTRHHDNYTASYPANGEMMILYNTSSSHYSTRDTNSFTVKWECDEDTPVVPPAESYDSSDYLTLAQSGTYERLHSQRRDYNWIIPCTGTLSIAEELGDVFFSEVRLVNSNGSVYVDYSGTLSTEYQVDGNFLVQLKSKESGHADNHFSLSWKCVRRSETVSAFVPPPTTAPLPPCEQTSSPLKASFPPENAYQYMKCWTFQCKGTVHMTFLNVTVERTLSLANSDGYQLTSLTRYHDNYTASYPANGEMMILYNTSSSHYSTLDTNSFTVKWECDEDTPVVPPAESYDSSDYLTLAQSGTYERLHSQRRDYNWIIPCTGTLSIAEELGDVFFSEVRLVNSNGSVYVDYSGTLSTEYQVDGNFLVQLKSEESGHADNLFSFSWNCVRRSETVSAFVPPPSAPASALPTATPTGLPAASTLVPLPPTPTPAPHTALPTPDLPAGTTTAAPPPAENVLLWRPW